MLIAPVQNLEGEISDDEGSVLRAWRGGELLLEGAGTHYGIVVDGLARLHTDDDDYPLRPGCYFSAPSTATLRGEGSGIVITRANHRGLFNLGGPVERVGRLKYMDGCSDTVLLAPLRSGDPCVNLLHMPVRTSQRTHTHPSLRVGVILEGSVTCISRGEKTQLDRGCVFVIPSRTEHSFHTFSCAASMVVYHPDSDFGPTDEMHPMLTRTLVNDVPASDLRRRGLLPVHEEDARSL